MLENLSIIPVAVTKQDDGTFSKKPNFGLLESATGGAGWNQFTTRIPTEEEMFVFNQSEYQGIVTGQVSGVTVIDLDGDAENELKELGFEFKDIPMVRTPSGGKHLYFKYDPDYKTVSKINSNNNIDIRNDSGFVVAFGEGYEWVNQLTESNLTKIPETFKEQINKWQEEKKNQKDTSESKLDAYSEARQVDMVEFLTSKGYLVRGNEEMFSCIFENHTDSEPSAHIIKNKSGDDRYVCFSHKDGEGLNLSIIDLWARLRGISVEQSLKEVLAHIGVEYKEGEFVKSQKDKYEVNRLKIGNKVDDLEYLRDNFPNLHKYIDRYEMELRALMEYAETNLYGTKYSVNGQAIFYLSSRHAGELFRKSKGNSSVDEKKANKLLNLFCVLGFIYRIPSEDIGEHASRATSKYTRQGSNQDVPRKISFYAFNELNDSVLSRAEHRAKIMRDSNFKISTMSKDSVYSIFGDEIANEVYLDKRTVSGSFKEYLSSYSKLIMEQIQEHGYATKEHIVSLLNDGTTRNFRTYHFEKVINEICNSYNLKFTTVQKDKKQELGIDMKTRCKVIYEE